MILTPAWSGQQIFRRQKIDLGYVTSLNFPFLFYVIWQLTAVPKIASTFSGRLIYAPSRLRNVFPVLPLFKGRSSISSSFYASLLQAIDGVMSFALCPQLVSQQWRAWIAQWLERRTPDLKVVGSSPGRSGGRIFFSRVNF